MLHRSAGFTLIELIVSVAILSIVTSVGIAGFISFQDNQKVLSAAKEVQQLFVDAQVKARVKETPPAPFCTAGSLQGYKVVKNGNTFSLQVVCSSIRERDSVTVNNVTITENIPTPNEILFRTQYDGITPVPATEYILCFENGSNRYRFSISRTGQISDITQVASCS